MPARISSTSHKADIEALYDYADKAFDKLCEAWGLKPAQNKYALLVMDRPGGGFATGDIGEVHAITGRRSPGIGCSYDAFFGTANGIKGYWAHILITHEMVNSFTGQIVGGGWPVDWWANHRSPFPLMTAVEIEYALVPNMAVFHEQQGRGDPLVRMFMHLKDQYGWAMFRKAFRAAIDDGIQWDAFGANPSAPAHGLCCRLPSDRSAGRHLRHFGAVGPRLRRPDRERHCRGSFQVGCVAGKLFETPDVEKSFPSRRLQGRSGIVSAGGEKGKRPLGLCELLVRPARNAGTARSSAAVAGYELKEDGVAVLLGKAE